MDVKFCPVCGKPWKAGSSHCEYCNAQLPELFDAPIDSNNDANQLDNTAALSIKQSLDAQPSSETQYREETQDIDDAQNASESQHAREAQQQSETQQARGTQQALDTITANNANTPLPLDPQKIVSHEPEEWYHDRKALYLLVAITAVTLLFLGISLSNCSIGFHDPQAEKVAQWQRSGANKQKEETAQSSSTAESNEPTQSSAPQESAEDEATHDTLNTYYDKLKDYGKQVDQAEKTYLDTYANRDHDIRNQKQEEARTLTQKISDDSDALSQLTISDTSKYSEQFKLIEQCFSDLLTRMGTVNDSWDVNVLYNYPDYYPTELTELFTEAQADGSDEPQAKLDFEKNFKQIKL